MALRLCHYLMFGGAFFGLLVSVGLLMLKYKMQNRPPRPLTAATAPSPRNIANQANQSRQTGAGDRNRAVLEIERENVYAEDLN